MRIAVFIKSKELRSRFESLLGRYKTRTGCELSCRFYETDLDLLASLIAEKYDAIFLDSFQNIAELIAEIREKDHWVRLIPVETAARWTQAEYGSETWYCLPALVSEALLFPLLGRLEVELQQDSDAGLVVKSRQGIVHIRFSDLEYVEVINRVIRFNLFGTETAEVLASLSEYEEKLLSRRDFIKVHRSYIVNLRYVQRLGASGIITRSGRSVPVSKHLYPELRKDYLCRLSDPGAMPSAPPQPPSEKSADYRILLVDDDSDERDYWSRLLMRKGCRVVVADCGAAAMRAAADGVYSCVLLDVMLGNEKGFDLCARLSERTGAPIIFLSSKGDVDSQLEGFRVGGMDYIPKDTEEELFWVKVKTRIGPSGVGRTVLRLGPLCIDLNRRQAELDSVALTLTTVEFDLLCLLAQHAGEVCTPEEIYHSLWDESHGGSSQSIQMQMSRLRRKLEKACPSHSLIETVWGEGYRFTYPEQP